MKLNSPVDIFFLIKKIDLKLNEHRNVSDSSLAFAWKALPSSFKNKMIDAWNMMNSHIFTEDCLKSYIYDIFVESICNSKKNIYSKFIPNLIEKYNRKVFKNQRRRDENFVRLFLSKQKMAKEDLFKVGDTGISPSAMLLEKGYISPFVLVENIDKCRNVELSNEKQKKLFKLVSIIKEVN